MISRASTVGLFHDEADMTTRRLMIVDDVSKVRTDLRTLLGLSGDIEIVGEAGNGIEAITLAANLQPDVILMDLEMPLMSGYEATRRIKDQLPTCRIIALSVHGYPEARQHAQSSGVNAFIVKGEPVSNLLNEILKEV
jgi:DNA-binding NarL/FixJ family response regulator